jgi:hypothetical protein
MNITVRIENNNQKAQSIINMLKELAKDYSFISIWDESEDISDNIAAEIEARYNYIIEHPEDGSSWEEVKKRILSE